MWSNKNKRIEFFNSDPAVIDTFPIIEAKDLKLNWVKETRKNYQEHVHKGHASEPGFKHIARCPGIFDLFKYGYIVSLHKDIIIKLDMEGGFEWIVPSEIKDKTNFHVEYQSTALIANPPWATDFIIKITTGWNVVAPRDLRFLYLPIAYPDTFDFTCTTGIFNPAISTEVNFQVYWNATESPETVIRAGTPLGHLIPLTEKRYEWTQRVSNQHDRDWLKKLNSAFDASFWSTTMRGKIVDMYNNYWKL